MEHRLDNVVWRAGILPTHLSARQAVSHGHFLVNGKKVYVPSFTVKNGDKITIREGSRNSKLFNELAEDKKEILIKDQIFTENADLLFDLGQVIEYYQR